MAGAKDIILKFIDSKSANAAVKKWHYSGKVVNNSVLHIGVFFNDRLGGVMQFGSPLDKRKVLPLVRDTKWNDMLELNRMAFSDLLPRNSESRAIAVAMRLIRKHYPNIEWVLSFADGTQCGDGTIYRASGFVLTKIGINKTLLKMPNGDIISDLKLKLSPSILSNTGGRVSYRKLAESVGAKYLDGFQLRYIYFLNQSARDRLTVPIIPFSEIEKRGAGMYKGQKRGGSADDGTLATSQRGRFNSDPAAPISAVQ